jgi:hypothetical protein
VASRWGPVTGKPNLPNLCGRDVKLTTHGEGLNQSHIVNEASIETPKGRDGELEDNWKWGGFLSVV